jgi:hypothetical protein
MPGTLRYGLVLLRLRELQWRPLKFACREIQWNSLNAARVLCAALRPGIADGLREFQWIALKFACREIQWDSLNAAELPGGAALRLGFRVDFPCQLPQ